MLIRFAPLGQDRSRATFAAASPAPGMGKPAPPRGTFERLGPIRQLSASAPAVAEHSDRLGGREALLRRRQRSEADKHVCR
jgi:hypothetical protein